VTDRPAPADDHDDLPVEADEVELDDAGGVEVDIAEFLDDEAQEDPLEVEIELVTTSDDDGEGDGDDVGEIDETVADGRVAYDCATWAGESRSLLASLLDTNEIRHAWQGTTVTVFEEDEETVDALIDDVMASARPALDAAAEKLVYEVGAWPAALQTSLADALTVADLPYEWDARGDLVVYAEHEAEVEAILEQLPDPEDPEVQDLSSDDGLAVHEVLDQLFVGSDRLARRPEDASAVIGVDRAASDLERMPPPFGFEPPQWRALVGRATRLRDALAAGPDSDDSLDDDELKSLAGEVRDLVRQYV
jgi:hypothetical protein